MKKFLAPFGTAPFEKFQKALILAFEANSAFLSLENETKIVKITHSGKVTTYDDDGIITNSDGELVSNRKTETGIRFFRLTDSEFGFFSFFFEIVERLWLSLHFENSS